MLERVQTEIGEIGRLRVAVNSDNSALFVELGRVHRVPVVVPGSILDEGAQCPIIGDLACQQGGVFPRREDFFVAMAFLLATS